MSWSESERVRFRGVLRRADAIDYDELGERERAAFEASWSFARAFAHEVERSREWDRWEHERRLREERIRVASFRRYVLEGGSVLPWSVAKWRLPSTGMGIARLGAWVVAQVMAGPFVVKRPGREPLVVNEIPRWCAQAGVYGPSVYALQKRVVGEDDEWRREFVAAQLAGRVLDVRPLFSRLGAKGSAGGL